MIVLVCMRYLPITLTRQLKQTLKELLT